MGVKSVVAAGVVAAAAASWLIWSSIGGDSSQASLEPAADKSPQEVRALRLETGDQPGLEGNVLAAPQSERIAEQPEKPSSPRQVARPPRFAPGPGRIVGRVTDSEGKALTVSVTVHARWFRKTKPFHQSTNDPDGYFLVSGLGPTEYEVSLHAPGFVRSVRNVRPGEVLLDVALEQAYSIAGVLVEKATGAPMPGVQIRARGEAASWDESFAAATREDGTFEIEGVPAGSFELSFGSKWQEGSRALRVFLPTTVRARSGATDVRIEAVRGLEIAGEILDASGAPTRTRFRIQVMARTPHGDPDMGTRRFTHSSSDGTFRVTGLPVGRYAVTLHPETRRPDDPGDDDGPTMVSAARLDGVEAGRTDIVIHLTEGKALNGRIVDEAGEAVTVRGNLYIYPEGAGPSQQGSIIVSVNAPGVSAGGYFKTPAIDPNVPYEIFVTHFDGFNQTKVKGIYATDAELVITLKSAVSIRGRVKSENGQRVPAGVWVIARATDAPPGAKDGFGMTYTGNAGSFMINGLGTYKYTLIAGGGTSPFVSAEPVSAQHGDTDVQVPVKLGVAVSGTLVDQAGEPVRTNQLSASAGDSPIRSWTSIESPDGRFTLRGVPRGAVRFQAMIGGKFVDLGTRTAPATDVTLTIPE